MKKEKLFGFMLFIVAILLLLNLLSHYDLLPTTAIVRAEDRFHRVQEVNPQNLGFRGNGIGLTCSSDGKYVYAAGSRNIFRSENYGRAGSWELVMAD